jgi:hypothetical protein
MSRIRIKFHGKTPWLLAATVISVIEIYAACGRGTSVSPTRSDRPNSLTLPHRVTDVAMNSLPIGILDGSAEERGSAILVLGNLGMDPNVDLIVTLNATPQSTTSASMSEQSELQTRAVPGKSDMAALPAVASTDRIRKLRDPFPASSHQKSDRVYFLPKSIRSSPTDQEHSPIHCRLHTETPRVRIYVDQRTTPNEPLAVLINAIETAATSGMADVIEKLVGPVADVDHDSHLAVVLTPDLSRFGTGPSSVDGMTRPADFVPGFDRPEGNNSDVIFLSSALNPGDHLRAVLAHEWCHAAVFSRRMRESDRGIGPTIEEDWLNEAVAHLVEVRASGSSSNISHRIRGFMAHPAQSPLVVSDYCRPEFWRHDGCRGAAYLFLNWCLDQGDDDLLERLLDSQSLGLDGLEAATGTSFEQLFQGWTRSLAQNLADDCHRQPDVSAKDEARTPVARLTPRTWDLGSSGARTITVRIGGTCAEFIRVQCDPGTTWRLSATASVMDSLQTALIPVPDDESTARSRDRTVPTPRDTNQFESALDSPSSTRR